MVTKCPWLTTHEAAELLGISESGARWLADTRQVRAIRTPGGRRLLSLADVQRFSRERSERTEESTESR